MMIKPGHAQSWGSGNQESSKKTETENYAKRRREQGMLSRWLLWRLSVFVVSMVVSMEVAMVIGERLAAAVYSKCST